MTITKSYILRILMYCLLINILPACDSKDQKTDEAFERVKEEKMSSNNSGVNNSDTIKEETKTKLEKKVDNCDEWAEFKSETESKILINERKIKEIKNLPNTNGKLFRKVVFIERDNDDLRDQMIQYNKETKERWEKFKMKINQNVSDINLELKEIAINAKNELAEK